MQQFSLVSSILFGVLIVGFLNYYLTIYLLKKDKFLVLIIPIILLMIIIYLVLLIFSRHEPKDMRVLVYAVLLLFASGNFVTVVASSLIAYFVNQKMNTKKGEK